MEFDISNQEENETPENFANKMFRAFSIPPFRYLWINTITFSLVQGMALLTFLQLARELSESNRALGFFGFAVGIPVLIFGLPIGIIAALNHNKPVDYGSRFLTVLGLAIPNFVLALVLQLIFAHELGWFPIDGPRRNHCSY